MYRFHIVKDTESKPWNRHFQFCVGSGHAALALRKDYCEQLKYIHDTLGIQRVRMHGIFHDDMHTLHTLKDVMPIEGAERIKEESFHMVGKVYDNILDAGMQPFVELGFMPRELAANEKQTGMLYYHPVVGMPKDDVQWTRYIRRFIEYLLHRYGNKEVEQWYFEVWNEPDLPIGFFFGSQQDYFHLYEITARTIKAVNPKLKVGGPSTSGSKWVAPFVKFCKENDVPVDFITTHQYAGDPFTGLTDADPAQSLMATAKEMNLSPELMGQMSSFDPKKLDSSIQGMIYGMMGKGLAYLPDSASILDAMRLFHRDNTETAELDRNVFQKNAEIVREQAEGLPVYYTEWNTSATFGGRGNDTRKVAAYNLRTALSVEDIVDGSSIWCFSDIFEELHPFPQEFHGGFGLMTKDGIPKPVVHGLKLLAEAYDERLVIPGGLDGEISIAAFRKGKALQILLIRQNLQHLAHEYDPKEHAAVSIELGYKPDSVTLKRIDEAHCSPLEIWEAMGSPADLTRAKVQAIKEQSAMREEPMDYSFEDGTLSFEAALGVNDVYFITIQ